MDLIKISDIIRKIIFVCLFLRYEKANFSLKPVILVRFY